MAQLKSTLINGSLTVSGLTANKIVTTSTDGLLTTFANGSANSLLMSDGTNASWVTPKIEGVSLKDGMLYYGLCTTAANTAAKTVTLTNTQTFTLTTGARVFIKFQNTNTVASPTLNVNSTGAKSIMAYGSTPVGKTVGSSWQDNAIIEFVYDGNYWVIASPFVADLHADISLGPQNELEIGAQLSKTGSATLITDSNYTTYFTQNQNGTTYPWVYDTTNTYWYCSGTQDIHNITEDTTLLSWTVKSNMVLSIDWSVHSESVSYDWLRILVNGGEKLKKGGNNQSGNIELKLKTNDIINFVVRKDTSSNPTGEYYRVILNRYATTSVNAVNINKLFINGNGDFGSPYKPIYLTGGTIAPCSYSYASCTTAAGTAAKTASLTDFVLETGAFVFVKFTYTNTATNPTLNINSTGAKQIMRYGTTPPGNVAGLSWYAGAVVGFVYDGTYWQMMNGANMLDAYIV